MTDFIPLDRLFTPITNDEAPDPDIGREWTRRHYGGLDWPDLLERRRVVILAEALSGKTEEMRARVCELSKQQRHAYFVRIEELADIGFGQALSSDELSSFQAWQTSENSEAWFFLDSVDEARLNRKSFETALKRLASALAEGAARARIFITCRASDWRGRDDRTLVERILPSPVSIPPKEEPKDQQQALLEPIFQGDSEVKQDNTQAKPDCDALLIVQLLPLSRDQRRLLAHAAGVGDIEAFDEQVIQHGLDAMAERPGDLLALADYWVSHKAFADLRTMTEYSVMRKLSERDLYRGDNDTLSPEKARLGAERIAAALTLGKSFTIQAPAQDPDPTLAAGALPPGEILKDWTDAEVGALLRRGIFAISTYGRLRFHHRSTQEYLTASWLNGLLAANCPKSEVWDLVFAERYGVETVRPSLRPAAAWLACDHHDIRAEIVRREPLVLLRHGDPKSLPIDTRKQLLRAYAEKSAKKQLSDDNLDHKAIWLFADARLADAIRDAWGRNTSPSFRIDLLRFITEAKIGACLDLARQSFSTPSNIEYLREMGMRAMLACDDVEGLKAAVPKIIGSPETLTASFACAIASHLYPVYFGVEALVSLIDRSNAPRPNYVEGFPHVLLRLYDKSDGASLRTALCERLANLCLLQPHAHDWGVSARHLELARHLTALATAEIKVLGTAAPTPAILRLLTAISRAGGENHGVRDEPLTRLVRQNKLLNRALFWIDVKECCEDPSRKVWTVWNIHFRGVRLWSLDNTDSTWLYDDVAALSDAKEKRVGLSALLTVLREGDQPPPNRRRLEALAASDATLLKDIADHFLPPKAYVEELDPRVEASRAKRVAHEEQAKASWIEFRDRIIANPGQLLVPAHLASFDGVLDLHNLTRWLNQRTKERGLDAARHWRLLAECFGGEAPAAYRDALKAFWRAHPAERPKHRGSTTTTKFVTYLAFAGVELEALDDEAWTKRLTPDEAALAARHACMSEQGFPRCLASLVRDHPDVVGSIVADELAHEWRRGALHGSLLSHYQFTADPIPAGLGPMILNTLLAREAAAPETLEAGLRVIARIVHSEADLKRLAAVARRRFRLHDKADREAMALGYLAILVFANPSTGIGALLNWIERREAQNDPEAGMRALAYLFEGRNGAVATALQTTPTSELEALLHLAYRYAPRAAEERSTRARYVGVRDRTETARNVILSAVLDRPGPHSFAVLTKATKHVQFRNSRERFLELAHGKAERDAEALPWSPADVLKMEREHSRSVTTGADLLRMATAVLSDIRTGFANADASSRALLCGAKDEAQIQAWLLEQLLLRARGRYHAHREAEVATGDMPDIIVSSTTAPVEIAVEIKHGGMGWSPKSLSRALRRQLAEDYLKPENRRHGILFVTHHGNRTWRDPQSRKRWQFGDLIAWLDQSARAVTNNARGAIEICVFGLDASRRAPDHRQGL